jgi:hypothetical protein
MSQRLAQLRNLEPEIAFLNYGRGPYQLHDLALADYAAARLDENMKDIKRSASDTDRSTVFQEYSCRRKQAVTSEPKLIESPDDRVKNGRLAPLSLVGQVRGDHVSAPLAFLQQDAAQRNSLNKIF